MTTATLISKFNGLDGKKVSKATLVKLKKAAVTLSQSKGDTANTINKKLTAAIQQMNGHKSINIKLSEPIKLQAISDKPKVKKSKPLFNNQKTVDKRKEGRRIRKEGKKEQSKPAPTVIPESAASQESAKKLLLEKFEEYDKGYVKVDEFIISEVDKDKYRNGKIGDTYYKYEFRSSPKTKTAKPQGDSHASEKTEAQNDDTKKASVTSKEAKKPTEKSPKSKKRLPRAKKSPRNDVKKPTLSGLPGFTRADQAPSKPEGELFTLPGEVGKWLGEQQRFRLVISLDGETHAGKSELAKKIVNAFAEKGNTIVWLDLEQGGMESKDTRASFERNVTKANMQRVFVGGGPATKEDIEQLAKNPDVDVIAIDSATKVKVNDFTNGWMEDLRTRYPNKIFLAIWQQNAQGGTRGGSSVNFDAPVHIKVYRPDHTDYKANYAEFLKNRGNATDKTFRLHDNKIMDINPDTDE